MELRYSSPRPCIKLEISRPAEATPLALGAATSLVIALSALRALHLDPATAPALTRTDPGTPGALPRLPAGYCHVCNEADNDDREAEADWPAAQPEPASAAPR